MKRFLLVAILAIFATAACSDKNNEPGPIPQELPEATIVTVPNYINILPNMRCAFNATLNEPAKEEVVITVTNKNTNIITVAANEIRIPTGETSGTVAFTTGGNAGSAYVTFTSESAIIKTPEVRVSVPLVD